MRFRTALAVIVTVLVAGFFFLNWRVFSTPATVSFLVTSVSAPLGLVMLSLFALLILVLAIYVGGWQTTLIMEFRRQSRELEAQRTLAESAEASRFTELGGIVRDEIEKLRAELRNTENSIAATLGEMDDRFRRVDDGGFGAGRGIERPV